MVRWFIIDSSGVLVVHTALLHTNEIILFSGNEHDQGQHDGNAIDQTRLFNCETLSLTNPGLPDTDVFL
jgi:hypothetical protein